MKRAALKGARFRPVQDVRNRIDALVANTACRINTSNGCLFLRLCDAAAYQATLLFLVGRSAGH
ncbi:MAG: hypothetical protein OJF52_000384 [Nitrospira sp.]|nr:MAG: hypothetical protein OJF52_000384 [Nitrospira sp.]